MKMKSRRTLTYFHSGSLDMVRAPQRRMPRPCGRKSMMQLTPLGLSSSCMALVIGNSRSVALITTSLAGALFTPAVDIGAGDHPCDMPARRNQAVVIESGVKDPDPGPVERWHTDGRPAD